MDIVSPEKCPWPRIFKLCSLRKLIGEGHGWQFSQWSWWDTVKVWRWFWGRYREVTRFEDFGEIELTITLLMRTSFTLDYSEMLMLLEIICWLNLMLWSLLADNEGFSNWFLFVCMCFMIYLQRAIDNLKAFPNVFVLNPENFFHGKSGWRIL